MLRIGGETGGEDALDGGTTRKIGLIVLARADAGDKSVQDRWGRVAVDVLPVRLMHILSMADFQDFVGMIEVEAEGTAVAVDAEAQAVEVARGPAGHLDRAECAIGQFREDECGIIRIERIGTDLIVRGFGKRFKSALHGFKIARWISCKI